MKCRAVQTSANLVDLEKCCKMGIWTQKSASIPKHLIDRAPLPSYHALHERLIFQYLNFRFTIFYLSRNFSIFQFLNLSKNSIIQKLTFCNGFLNFYISPFLNFSNFQFSNICQFPSSPIFHFRNFAVSQFPSFRVSEFRSFPVSHFATPTMPSTND